MPQLNPAPWFIILAFSWMTFLVIIPPKVMSHISPNEPTQQSTKKPNAKSWTWPWY